MISVAVLDEYDHVYWYISSVIEHVQGKIFSCQHGVCQGDALSPIHFVSVAELLLQCMVNPLSQEDTLQAPLPMQRFVIAEAEHVIVTRGRTRCKVGERSNLACIILMSRE
jgi:hypothetical protein